jgi:hypothetical protein
LPVNLLSTFLATILDCLRVVLSAAASVRNRGAVPLAVTFARLFEWPSFRPASTRRLARRLTSDRRFAPIDLTPTAWALVPETRVFFWRLDAESSADSFAECFTASFFKALSAEIALETADSLLLVTFNGGVTVPPFAPSLVVRALPELGCFGAILLAPVLAAVATVLVVTRPVLALETSLSIGLVFAFTFCEIAAFLTSDFFALERTTFALDDLADPDGLGVCLDGICGALLISPALETGQVVSGRS